MPRMYIYGTAALATDQYILMKSSSGRTLSKSLVSTKLSSMTTYNHIMKISCVMRRPPVSIEKETTKSSALYQTNKMDWSFSFRLSVCSTFLLCRTFSRVLGYAPVNSSQQHNELLSILPAPTRYWPLDGFSRNLIFSSIADLSRIGDESHYSRWACGRPANSCMRTPS